MAATGGGAIGAADDGTPLAPSASLLGPVTNPSIMVIFQGPLSARKGMPTPLADLNIAGELDSVERAIRGTNVRLDAIGGPWDGMGAMRRPGVRVVEIGCHGTPDAEHLVVEDPHGAGLEVKAETLRDLFADNPDTRLVVLSACFSADIARRAFVGVHERSVIAIDERSPVRDDAAVRFTRALYENLVKHNASVRRAFDAAVTAVRTELGARPADVFQLLPEDVDHDRVVPFPREEGATPRPAAPNTYDNVPSPRARGDASLFPLPPNNSKRRQLVVHELVHFLTADVGVDASAKIANVAGLPGSGKWVVTCKAVRYVLDRHPGRFHFVHFSLEDTDVGVDSYRSVLLRMLSALLPDKSEGFYLEQVNRWVEADGRRLRRDFGTQWARFMSANLAGPGRPVIVIRDADRHIRAVRDILAKLGDGYMGDTRFIVQSLVDFRIDFPAHIPVSRVYVAPLTAVESAQLLVDTLLAEWRQVPDRQREIKEVLGLSGVPTDRVMTVLSGKPFVADARGFPSKILELARMIVRGGRLDGGGAADVLAEVVPRLPSAETLEAFRLSVQRELDSASAFARELIEKNQVGPATADGGALTTDIHGARMAARPQALPGGVVSALTHTGSMVDVMPASDRMLMNVVNMAMEEVFVRIPVPSVDEIVTSIVREIRFRTASEAARPIRWTARESFRAVERLLRFCLPDMMERRPLAGMDLFVPCGLWVQQAAGMDLNFERNNRFLRGEAFELSHDVVHRWVTNSLRPWILVLREIQEDWAKGSSGAEPPRVVGFSSPRAVDELMTQMSASAEGTYIIRMSNSASPPQLTCCLALQGDEAKFCNFRLTPEPIPETDERFRFVFTQQTDAGTVEIRINRISELTEHVRILNNLLDIRDPALQRTFDPWVMWTGMTKEEGDRATGTASAFGTSLAHGAPAKGGR